MDSTCKMIEDLTKLFFQEEYYLHDAVFEISKPLSDYKFRDKYPKYYNIKIGKMYSSPVINFSVLKKLSEMFGTEEIDVDDYAYKGCDTCDHGSEYGHEIQIYGPTKLIEELEQCIGKDLLNVD